ncbi:MAG: hypothetical protein SFU98_17070 [Leptospiraceae bacterium]|nr:hypothetical protein [Leptospiraceae bacterium]
MIIKKDEIELNGGADFFKFVSTNDLFGSVQLKEPILDPLGNVLIREKVNLNETLVKKIASLEGKHVSILKVNISRGLTIKLAEKVARETLLILDEKDDPFISHLFDNNLSNNTTYRSVIENALFNKKVSLFAFRLYAEKKEFFRHCVKQGLLSLGVALQKSHMVKMINRNSYLSGFFADICVMDSGLWKDETISGDELNVISRQTAQYMPRLGLPGVISSAHSSIDFKSIKIEGVPKPNLGSGNINVSNSYFDYTEAEEEPSNPDEEMTEEEIAISREVIGEALKIVRFVKLAKNSLVDITSEEAQEKLIVSFAYNMEKGVFSKTVGEPMLQVFKKFEEKIIKIRNVAKVENMCKFPPSAWAYPKPEPTQILCRDKKTECPHLVSGWDISIFSEQNAFGHIGARLRPGQYPKCRLEEKLDISSKKPKLINENEEPPKI